MKAETLKKAILQYAMQGKLVEQDPNDEPASVLLERIKAEKEQLIKDGKIKKEKPLSPITEDEIPYELPKGWEWVRLRDVVYNHGQKTPNQTFSYIDIGSINNKQQRLNINENIIKPEDAPSRARKIVKLGDVIYSTVRPYLHNMCIIDKNFSCEPIASTGFAVLSCHTGLSNKYLLYYLLSPDFDNYANSTDNSKGVAYPAINDDRLYKALVSIPPLVEQERIVEKLEQILPLVEVYGKNEEKLSKLNSTLPDKIKQSILQHAVQGKLVPQNPDDESASVLLSRIKAEKEQLIKDGKIKKEKTLPPITQDEIPYELPKGWEWVRLSQITSIIGDGIHGTPAYTLNTEYYFINGNNLNNGTIEIKDNTKTVSENEYLKYKKDLNERTVLVSINGTLGNVAFYNNEKVMLGKSACYFNLLAGIDKLYMKLILNSDYFLKYADNKATGTTIKNVSLKAMQDLLIPLPPLAEQQRIVTKVEELLSTVDSLKV